MKYLQSYKLFEGKSNLKFNKRTRKKGAKTDTYEVVRDGVTLGLIKWSSRMRGYAFLPTSDIDIDVKDFIKQLMTKRREESKKKNPSN